MGLDSVELALAMEEEFGVMIPDDELYKMLTVGDTFEYLKQRLKSSPPEHCAKQRIFFRFRNALIKNYNISRNQIKVDTKLNEIVPTEELKQGWPFLKKYIDLEYPDYEESEKWFGLTMGVHKNTDKLTIGEIVTTMVTLNEEKIIPEPGTHDQLWVSLTKLIKNQTGVKTQEIQPDSRYVKDLGVD